MLKKLIEEKGYIRLDGGTGTMLQKNGMPAGAVPEVYNITEPERIIAVNRAYAQAGADIICANTFGANRLKMKKTGYTPEELIRAGVRNAKKAAEGTRALVAPTPWISTCKHSSASIMRLLNFFISLPSISACTYNISDGRKL